MTWLALLARFWKPLAGILIGAIAVWYLHHHGYESGFAASEAKWQPLFAKAERERDEANARTEMKEAESNRAAAESQRRIDETLQTLHVRAADYDGRLRSLSMRLSAARSRSCEVPATSGTTVDADAATQSDQRAAEVGSRIAGIGSDCESDAAAKVEWQRFYTELRSTINREN